LPCPCTQSPIPSSAATRIELVCPKSGNPLGTLGQGTLVTLSGYPFWPESYFRNNADLGTGLLMGGSPQSPAPFFFELSFASTHPPILPPATDANGTVSTSYCHFGERGREPRSSQPMMKESAGLDRSDKTRGPLSPIQFDDSCIRHFERSRSLSSSTRMMRWAPDRIAV
jgi:hypothetical protein